VANAGIETTTPIAGVEVLVRRNNTTSFLFVINHNATSIDYPATGTELTTGQEISGSVTVPAGGVRVVRLVSARVLHEVRESL
jgi:beta-galactosidase